MYSISIDTPLGVLWARGDENWLYELSFSQNMAESAEKETALMKHLKSELLDYFKGSLQVFTVPLKPQGTLFQQNCWQALQTIPYGQVKSYQEQAKGIGACKAYRAVGNANAKNPIAIIIPCHRVVRSNGNLGGYAYGVERKNWLLEHERSFSRLSLAF